MARKRRRLGEILCGWGKLSELQLAQALKIAEGQNKRIGETLVELGVVKGSDVAKALASQVHWEFVDLDKAGAIDKEGITAVDRDVITKYLVLPANNPGPGEKLKLLIHDPNDMELHDTLRFRLNRDIDFAIAAKSQIKAYIERNLSATQASIDQVTRDLSQDRGDSLDHGNSMDRGTSVDGGNSMDLSVDRGASVDRAGRKANRVKVEEESPVIRLVEKIITDAVRARASDIHVEPMEQYVRLRFRIDGVCHIRERIPKSAQSGMVARLKVISGMKLDERRIPLDGRIKLTVDGTAFDFRVSCCPCYHGPSFVLRILRPDSALVGLPNLGMLPDTLEVFNKVITYPNGIFLVTGPTGSGKTTTLYTALNELNTPNKKIITAEDPVEFQFKGINQCQIDPTVGRSFAMVLRAMLRQAPEIILVGEIRDHEVGTIAIQAALTGHLVFSTLHTNDAPSAITRLTDMGLKPFLVASSLQAVLAQRLIRLLCPKCKKLDSAPDPKTLRQVGITPEDLKSNEIYKPVGCTRCAGVGYRGRKGIYELMLMNHQLRELAYERAPLNKLQQAAIEGGMRNLLSDGRVKALQGMTSAAEVARVAQVEGVVDENEHIDEDEVAA